MPKDRDRDLPGTVQRSPAKARRTYRKAHDSAVDSYGEGERAHRTAYSALKKVAATLKDEPVVLIGAGGVGLMGVTLARKMGASEVIVVDIERWSAWP